MNIVISNPLENTYAWENALQLITAGSVLYVIPYHYETAVMVTDIEPHGEYAQFAPLGVDREHLTAFDLDDMVRAALFYIPCAALSSVDDCDEQFFNSVCSDELSLCAAESVKPVVVKSADKAVVEFITANNDPESTNCVIKNFKKSWSYEDNNENMYTKRGV